MCHFSLGSFFLLLFCFPRCIPHAPSQLVVLKSALLPCLLHPEDGQSDRQSDRNVEKKEELFSCVKKQCI